MSLLSTTHGGRIAVAVLVTLPLLTGCPRSKSAPKDDDDKPKSHAETDGGEHEHEGIPKTVHLPANVIASAKVTVAPVTKEVLRATIVLPGEVAADPDRTGRISSTVAGRLEEVRLQEGATIKKGDVVAVLRVPDLGKVRGAYAAANSKAAAARANAERLKELSESRLASTQSYLDAKAEAEALDAEAKALGEQLAALGAGGSSGSGVLLTLRSPIGGTVTRRDAVVGQPVSAEQMLGTVSDLSEAWFLGRVFEKDLGRLEQGARAEVELNAYPNERFDGVIEVLGQQIDPIARTLTARIRIKNRGGLLRLGLFGGARVDVGDAGKKDPTLVVPRSALTEIAGKPTVFVRTGDETFDAHDVVLGESGVGKVQVLAGLKEGELVVKHGVFTLKSVVLKGSFAEED
jgi:cobalt-zinc-cadmium efflux system membrane fusion protein